MRIGIGKKVGNFYIGTSVSGKKASKGLAMLFLWPFYLVYYLLIWPFVALFKALSNQTKKSKMISTQKKQASAMEAQSVLNVINSTLKIMSETKNPETFFSRVDLLRENVKKLASHGDVASFDGKNIETAVSEFEKAIPQATDSFLERYAKDTRLKIYDLVSEKAKRNKANAFKNSLSEFNDKMTQENIDHYLRLYDELLEFVSQQ